MTDPGAYLLELTLDAMRMWPDNRTLTIACHGHSVPAGYFATPRVDTFSAYPHLWHWRLKERFPWAVINVITTAIGGENSEQGASRFIADVLRSRPKLISIDYGLNDRGIGLARARAAWLHMISAAVETGAKVILLTPTWDVWDDASGSQRSDALLDHANMIRELAAETNVGLADAYAAFERSVTSGSHLSDLLSWPNHPNRRGHSLVADELMHWFPLVSPV
jgi:acyl-CoA thioesterase-1